jgi:hypothetical protein
VPHRRADHARLLLALAFGAPRDEVDGLSAADWAEIDRLADHHRLRPWLAERWADAALPIPATIVAAWRAEVPAGRHLSERGGLCHGPLRIGIGHFE